MNAKNEFQFKKISYITHHNNRRGPDLLLYCNQAGSPDTVIETFFDYFFNELVRSERKAMFLKTTNKIKKKRLHFGGVLIINKWQIYKYIKAHF